MLLAIIIFFSSFVTDGVAALPCRVELYCVLIRYEGMTQSPDVDEDKASQSSTDSRRQSEAQQPPAQQLEQPQVSSCSVVTAHHK
jgi:hypothetical protein